MVKPIVCCSIIMLLLPGLLGSVSLNGLAQPTNLDPSSRDPSSRDPSSTAARTVTPTTSEVLEQSWAAYRQRFIQADGRVIDWEQDARTVSEGQAYAMLRAVFADDPATFAQTLKWAEDNLRQVNPQADNPSTDSLWAWKWGQDPQGNWGILDVNFASDADLDAITALILASRRWDRPEYLDLARTKLKDLWELSTVTASPSGPPQRYFLPGPVVAFQPQPPIAYLNPSYLAPYAFRLFAQVDPERDWLSLVESSYEVLEKSTQLSSVNLPSDWVAIDLSTGQFQSPPIRTRLRSTYSFDAYRVWWRIALDAAWFNEPRAKTFLQDHTEHLQTLWQTGQMIPARISLRGSATARYEATSQYAMLYPAFQMIAPSIAEEMWQQKLLPTYKDGIWDNNSAYYVQNLAWLGLFPAHTMREWVEAQ
jgi:endo-1,4-beta-D-glucanase Y